MQQPLESFGMLTCKPLSWYLSALINLTFCLTNCYSAHVNSAVETHFPDMYQRMKDVNATVEKRYGIKPSFGVFWNFCVNAPYPQAGVKEVLCRPHIDAMNVAIGICVVLVYYVGQGELYSSFSCFCSVFFTVPKDRCEKVWLVLWEAGIIIQIPIGVLFIYPSALIMHFNVRLEGWFRFYCHLFLHCSLLVDFQIVVTPTGDMPTPANSFAMGSPEDANSASRCSMVWFTQGSVVRAAELAFTTMKATLEKEKEAQRKYPRPEPYFITTYDTTTAIASNYFPLVKR